jgi:homocysteine S-methyltransferase
MNPLFDLLERGVVIADGAMGTVLQQRGFPADVLYCNANLTHPDWVEAIHREYVAVGAQVIEANTYGATRLRLANSNLGEHTRAINVEGIQLARRAAEGKSLVAGAVGPIGKPLKPIGRIEPEEAYETFREQIAFQLEAGADIIMLETFADLEELRLAMEAAKSLSDAPIIAQKTFIEDGETLSAGLPREVCAKLMEWGATVVGANCTVGPQRMLDVARMMAEVGRGKISVLPTAGLPQLVGNRMVYDATPAYFARYGKHFVEAGIDLIGGCCGTTPEHIRALSDMVRDLKPAPKKAFVGATSVAPRPATEVATTTAPPLERSRFAWNLGKRFLITSELELPRGVDMNHALDTARFLHRIGVDAVNIFDGPRARLRMNNMVVGHLIQERVGIEVWMHFCCRDRNLLGIQSELLGAHALGVRNILAITGDPAQIGDYPDATSVFDVDAIGMVRILRMFNEGKDLAGNSITDPTSFLIAVAFNPTADDLPREIDRLKRKVDEGAEVCFTQPLFDRESLENAMSITDKINLPMMVGIIPLRSARHAEFWHNEVPGVKVPDRVRKIMADAPPDRAAAVGLELALDFAAYVRTVRAAGLYVMPPLGRYEMVEKIVEAVGER